MHCSDLERYLEACLDGQLGDGRRRALHDHLAICVSCRGRVDGLRHFEADLQRRLRAMQHEASLWQPLGLETVGGSGGASLPAPAPGCEETDGGSQAAGEWAGPETARLPAKGHPLRRVVARPAAGPSWWRLQNLAGAALLVAAVAAVTNMALSGLGWLGGDKRQAVYRAYLDGDLQLDLRTGDPGELEAWLGRAAGAAGGPARRAGELRAGRRRGRPVGAARGLGHGRLRRGRGPALLFIEALDDASPVAGGAPQLAMQDGLVTLEWQDQGNAYSLLSALPADKLALFAAD